MHLNPVSSHGPAAAASRPARGIRFRLSAFVLALGGAISSGCHGYYTPETSNPPLGRPVQLTLTDSGAVMLAPSLGPAVEFVRGELVADSAQQFVISVRGTQLRNGQETDWKGERVRIPRVLVAHLFERRFSRARTALFSVLTTAALVGITEAMRGPGGANAPGGSGPPPVGR